MLNFASLLRFPGGASAALMAIRGWVRSNTPDPPPPTDEGWGELPEQADPWLWHSPTQPLYVITRR